MQPNKKQSALARFLNSNKQYPVIAAIGAGLYPLFFYFTHNYTLINSWGHLGYFFSLFLIVPMVIFFAAYKISQFPVFLKVQHFVLPFLNLFVFLFLLKMILYTGIQKKIILAIVIISGVIAYFLYRHFKKWIILQFIMAAIGLFTLIPVLIKNIGYSTKWTQQPDTIEQAIFKKTPNVYYIQPDGYVNFSELKKGEYNFDNSAFENFVKKEGFTNYPDFRSNYKSTVSSNSAIFMMKHHYYNGDPSSSEVVGARKIIISENTVLNILKKNGYTTHLITETPYLLLNKPEMGFDKSNYNVGEIPFISTGLSMHKELLPSLKEFIKVDSDRPKFFFIEMLKPWHINSTEESSMGKRMEREQYLVNLKEANEDLRQMIGVITKKDPTALIIIMADHGGFVGLDYTYQTNKKIIDRDLVYSIFSSVLLIRWPDGEVPILEKPFKTSVNFFRILFANLAKNSTYLEHLQEDKSYMIINKGSPKGIYEYIDESGNVVFKKHS